MVAVEPLKGNLVYYLKSHVEEHVGPQEESQEAVQTEVFLVLAEELRVFVYHIKTS